MENHVGLQKIEIAKLKILEDILKREIGEKLETVTNYSENFNLSLGTIQKALTLLLEENVIKLEKKGKWGSVITFIDYEKLLQMLGKKFLLCVMPITYSEKYKTLLSQLEKDFKLDIPVYFAHMRGGNTRLRLIENKIYDFGIVSKLAALKAIENGAEIEMIKEFGKESYVQKHIILKRKKIGEKIKVGIDKESDDHVFLTNSYFLKESNIEFVDIRYSEVIEKIVDGTVDAAIWNYDDILNKEVLLKNNDIEYFDLLQNENNIYATEAVIVTQKDNRLIKNIFEYFVN